MKILRRFAGIAVVLASQALWAGNVVDVAPGEDLAAAIAAAEDGDVVRLAEGEYVLSAAITIAKPLTVKGAGRHFTRLVSDGGSHRLFVLNDPEAVLSDVTLKGANSGNDQGGAVSVEKGELRDAIVRDCRSTDYGGGVRVVAGAVRRCVLFNNVSGQGGGGLYTCLSGNGVVENTLAYRNSAQWGGGLYVESSSRATFVNCTFAENFASASGGDVYNYCSTPANNVFVNTYRGVDAKKSFGTLTASPDSSVVPGFVSSGAANFRLTETSPLWTQGVSVEPALDVQGVAHPPVPSIGAFQPEDNVIVPVAATAMKGGSVAVRVNLPDGSTRAGLTTVLPSGTLVRQDVAASGEVSVALPETGAYSLVLTAEVDGETVVFERFNVLYAGLGDVYVDSKSVNPEAPYDTPETAARTIDEAIVHVMDGGTVWICDGEHTLAHEFNLNRAVTIRGLHGAGSCVLKPTGSNRLFSLSHVGARVKGLTLRGSGSTCSQQGQVVCFAVGGVVEDCVLEDCSANGSGGAAVVLGGAVGRIERCIIRNNMGGMYGGGFYVAANGYGIVRNTLFYGNKAKNNWGSAVYVDGPGQMVNCTLFDNPVTPVNYGELCRNYAGFAVTNSIFGSVSWYTGGELNRANNLGGAASLADPGFRDRVAGDYRLGAGAIAAIDQGLDAAVAEGDLDLAGQPRRQGEHVDLGAYEYAVDEFSAGFTVVGEASRIGDEVQLVPIVSGGKAPIHRWRVVNVCDGAVLTGETSGTGEAAAFAVTFTTPGIYSFYDSVTDGDNADAPSLLEAVVIKADNDLYVAPSGHPAAPYGTPETALTNLCQAIRIVRATGTIHVLAGTHVLDDTVELNSGVKIVGAGRDRTVVASRPEAMHGLFYLNNSGAVVCDLAMTGSFAANYNGRNGACVAVQSGTVQDCLITNVVHKSVSVNGIAIHANSPYSRVRRVEIRGCQGGQYGVLYLMSGAKADNCLVADSEVSGNFGATVYLDSNSVASNCTFSAEAVNAAFVGTSICRFVNCLFDCPIRPTASTDVTNVFHHCVSTTSLRPNQGDKFFSHRIPDAFAAENNNISEVDVAFVDVTSGDFHLAPGSVAREYGLVTPAMRGELDLDRNRRVSGGKVDVGCYQSPQGLTIIFR